MQNLKEIRQEMQRSVRAHAHKNVTQNMTFDPIKDGTLGAASPKTIAARIFYQDTTPYKIWKKSFKKCSC